LLADLAARIKIEHEAYGAAARKGVEHAMAAGDLLLEAKAQLGRHGQWLPWLKEHCALSERTAQLYMRLARKRSEIEGKYESVADLTLRAAASSLAPDDPDDTADAGTGKNEWYTPSEWIDRARMAMGTIDVDPASCEFAQIKVRAAEWFDKERNGLAQQWRGNVWLNPPYSGGMIEPFIEKLVVERRNFAQAIVLVHSRTDAEWFHSLCSIADAIAFTKGRIRFYNQKVPESSPETGSVLVYIGKRRDAFAAAFADNCLVLGAPDPQIDEMQPEFARAA
jgi:phage N-6-adenine-methyltransferase